MLRETFQDASLVFIIHLFEHLREEWILKRIFNLLFIKLFCFLEGVDEPNLSELQPIALFKHFGIRLIVYQVAQELGASLGPGDIPRVLIEQKSFSDRLLVVLVQRGGDELVELLCEVELSEGAK